MDTPALIPRSWTDLLWVALAALLGYAAKTVPPLFTRRRTNAETARVEAETRSINVASAVSASDALMRHVSAITEVELTIERLRTERDYWRDQAHIIKAERDILQYEIDKRVRIGDGS